MTLNSTALLRATIGVIWLVVIMTIAAELSAPFKTLLAGLAGHHWVGKSIVAAIAFILLYLLFSKANESDNVARGAWQVALSVVVGGLAIFLFYLWHFISG